jgi:acyl transferase domain-containing protein
VGVDLDLGVVVPKLSPVYLPGYPFARDRHWIERAVPQPENLGDVGALLQAQSAVLRRQVALLEQVVSKQPLPEAAKAFASDDVQEPGD